ncbi:MAG: hypothetical protein KDD40_02820, partial [Bdellovibrionales bacterium]|nr:hypothetical protein [Bdellovibrionales bacterium]
MSPISVKKSDIVLPILLVFLTIFPPSLGLSSESGQHQKPTVFFNSVTENFRGTIVRPGNWDPITQSLIQMGSLALIGHHYISFEEEAIRTGENYLLKGGRLNRNVVRDLSYLDIVLKMNDSLSNWFVSVDPNPEGLMRSLGLLRDTPHGLAVRVFFHDELNEEQLIDKIFELKTLCQRFVGFSGSEEDFKNTSPQELLQYVKTTLSTASGSRSRFVNLDNQNIYQIKTGTWQVNGLKVPEHEQNNPRTSKLHNLSDGLHAILTTMRLVGADWKRRAHFMPEILAVRSGRDDSYVVRYMGSKDGSIWIPGYFFLLDGKKFNKEDQTVWKKFAMQDYISNARPIVLDLWARRLAQANLKAAVRANHWQNIYVKVDPTQGQVLDVQIIDGNDIRLSERAISEASTSIPTGYNSTIWTKPQAKGHESFIELHKQPQSEIEAYKFGLAALDELKIRLGLPFAVPARAFHFWAHHTHAGGEIALRMVVDRPDNLIEVCDNHPQICEQLGKTTQISQWLNVAHHWSEKGGTYRSAVHDIVKSFL